MGNDGFFKVHRKIDKSDIWITKPSWWFKVWAYIIKEVNFAESGKFKRGQQFFTLSKIHTGCYLSNDNVKVKTVDNVIRWLKSNEMLTTQKTTRGMIITICNYNTYQDVVRHENDTPNENGTRMERESNDTIREEGKNAKKKEEELIEQNEIYTHFLNPEFKENWFGFCDQRKEKKKPLTELAKKKALNLLHKWDIQKAIASLEKTIIGGYQGIFEPEKKELTKPKSQKTILDVIRENNQPKEEFREIKQC